MYFCASSLRKNVYTSFSPAFVQIFPTAPECNRHVSDDVATRAGRKSVEHFPFTSASSPPSSRFKIISVNYGGNKHRISRTDCAVMAEDRHI